MEATELLFADVPGELADWAVQRLRPQHAALCEDDRIFPRVFAAARSFIRRTSE